MYDALDVAQSLAADIVRKDEYPDPTRSVIALSLLSIAQELYECRNQLEHITTAIERLAPEYHSDYLKAREP